MDRNSGYINTQSTYFKCDFQLSVESNFVTAVILHFNALRLAKNIVKLSQPYLTCDQAVPSRTFPPKKNRAPYRS